MCDLYFRSIDLTIELDIFCRVSVGLISLLGLAIKNISPISGQDRIIFDVDFSTLLILKYFIKLIIIHNTHTQDIIHCVLF